MPLVELLRAKQFARPVTESQWQGTPLPGTGLRSVRIGIRLTCCFALIAIVTLAGAALAVWQMSSYNGQVERLRSIDRRMIAVLKVNNQVLSFREVMQNAAVNNDAERVRSMLYPFREAFLRDASEASAALQDYKEDNRKLERTLYTLMSYQTAIPGQVDTMLELAAFDDWQAIHFRLETQILKTSRVLTQIVGEIETDANTERKAALGTMTEIRRRVMGWLPASIFLVFLTCGVFVSTRVTKSIAEPLKILEDGAKALGSGDFSHRLALRGKDELAIVGKAFNTAAEQIEQLHSGLENLVAERTADLRRANESLQILSEQDPLTGIANRRTFDRVLQRSLSLVAESGKPVSLLMVDVDHFKSLNDTHGHPTGDECLIQVVRSMQSVPLRAHDLIARFGGEEFAVVLSETDSAGALKVAEKVRSAVEKMAAANCKAASVDRVTVSIGLATSIPGNALSTISLIEEADQALYRAKEGGRNRVSR